MTTETIQVSKIEETLSLECHPVCPCRNASCPPGCSCKTDIANNRTLALIFNALGILVAILATYMIINTDSKLYLVFWICYSVLRRMMLRSKEHLKSE
ncbi:hypothetical protein evm_005652 [Chilo suppressalis]|nr:hypothetical protein evm_005652 [Chilo suppressalis]